MLKTKFELKCEMAATILNGIISNGGAYQNYSTNQCIEKSAELADKLYEETLKLNKGDQ